ncbi:MAG: hypothetical protein JSS78_06915 [Bacteroidetes bacterium]|nr:hypothetical protein [Bacteroidota bacterium]
MEEINKDIARFISENTVATLACVDNQSPYCFNCYYAFLPAEGLLVYKSAFRTKHDAILEKNKQIAGSIVPNEINLSALSGIQFEGILLESRLDQTMRLSIPYYTRFPFAIALLGNICIIQMNTIKFTDYTKGVGYNLQWSR